MGSLWCMVSEALQEVGGGIEGSNVWASVA